MALRHVNIAVGLAVVLASAGCEPKQIETPPVLPEPFLREDWSAQEVPVAHIVRRDYRLREGDSLEIIYHVRHKRSESYKFQIEDLVVVRFPFNSSLNQIERVQSDGKLRLDLVGAVPVFERTIDEVQTELTKRYSNYIRNPILTVSLEEANKKIAELKQAIKTAPRGQSRLVPITPDGTIGLPFIVDIRAAGKTVGQLHKDLNKAYLAAGLEELEVTVNVQSVSPMRVYVLGEVKIPGTLLNRTGMLVTSAEVTLLQAIAQSGSYIPTRAELSKVMLIRRRNLPRPQAVIINVYQLLENRERRNAFSGPVVADSSKLLYDIWLEDGDIVYVPTSKIAKRADYIDYVWTRGIRAVGGFTSSATVGYGLSDSVNWVK